MIQLRYPSRGANYDADMRDLLDLQSRVAQAIVQQVGVKLTSREQLRIGTVRLINPWHTKHIFSGAITGTSARLVG